MPFPKKFQKDSLYVLVTRFEDYISKKQTECFGRSLVSRIDVISTEKKLPVRLYYNDRLAPKSKEEVNKIQKQYNADLVFWGSIKNIEKDCGAGDLCFRSQPSDTLIHLAGGDTSPQKMDVKYETGISPSDIEQGAFHVNEKWFDSWLLAIYNIKIGRFNPDLYVIDETLTKEEKAKAYIEKAKLFYYLKKYERVLSLIELSIVANPKEAQAYYYRGLLKSVSAKEKTEINQITDYSKAIELNPKYIAAFMLRASCKEGIKDYEDSILDATKAIELDSNNAFMYMLRGNTKSLMSNYKGAIEDYSKAIKLEKDDGLWQDYFEYRGIAKMNLQNYREAIKDFTRAIEFDSKKLPLYTNRGLSKYKLKDYQGAIIDYSKAIELNSKVASSFYYRGESKNNNKDYEGAIADFTKAIELDPKNSIYYINIGFIKQNLKDYNEALTNYSKAISIDSKNITLYSLRGNTKISLEDYKGAIEDYTRVIQINSKDYNAFSSRGTAKFNLKNYKGAVQDYSKMIELNPKEPSAYIMRGLIKDILNDGEGAIIDYTKAIKLNPNSGLAYYHRAKSNKELHFYEAVEKDFVKAKKLGYVVKRNLDCYYPLIFYLLFIIVSYIFKKEILTRLKTVNK
jgi:tetratricopeptide (TPR) repeat protein